MVLLFGRIAPVYWGFSAHRSLSFVVLFLAALTAIVVFFSFLPVIGLTWSASLRH